MNDLFTPESRQDMERAVRHICRCIRIKRDRRQAEQEYLEHLEDHAYRLMLKGVAEDKAVAEAVAALGDSEELCHMLCTVHNRLPPEFGSDLPWVLLRSSAALFVGIFLWGFGLLESYPILQAVPLLLIFGPTPFRYLRSLLLRIRQISRLRRVCRKQGYRIEQVASPILSVFFSAHRPEWFIHTPETTYCVHFLAAHNRHAALCLLDSYVYTLTTTHGQSARFVERPTFNIFRNVRTGDNTYENRSFHNLYFPLGADHATSGAERILLLNPVPSVIQYRKGTSMEYAGNGDRVFGFTLYDAKSFSDHLQNTN